ncbi:MAG: cohesin domain-containing protein [Chloroflexota bacterium]|nr:cohesin domain-containing protein [Chloroflexota bacterium]
MLAPAAALPGLGGTQPGPIVPSFRTAILDARTQAELANGELRLATSERDHILQGALRSLALIGACLALLALVSSPAAQTRQAGAAFQVSTAVGIDANPSGNSATSLGDIDDCVSVASGTTLEVDIFVADVSDLAGWQATLNYDPSVLVLTDAKVDLFLAADPGSRITDLSEPLPDEDGLYSFAVVDLIQPQGESGSGVLARAFLEAKEAGASTLTLDGIILGTSAAEPIGDIDGDQLFDGAVHNAQVAVDQSCPVVALPIPTAEPALTASPTAVETPLALATPSPTLPPTQPASPSPGTPAAQLTPAPLPPEGAEGGGFPWAVVAAASASGVAAAVVLGLALRRLLRRGS